MRQYSSLRPSPGLAARHRPRLTWIGAARVGVRREVPVQGWPGHAAGPHEFGDVGPLVGGVAERAQSASSGVAGS